MKSTKQILKVDKLDIKHFAVALLTIMPFVALTNPLIAINVYGIRVKLLDLLFISLVILWIKYTIMTGKIHVRCFQLLSYIILLLLTSLLGEVLLNNYIVRWLYFLSFIETMFWGVLAVTFIDTWGPVHSIIFNTIMAGNILSFYSIYLHIANPTFHRVAGYFSAAGGQGLGMQASFNEIGALYALASVLSLNYLFATHRNNELPRRYIFFIVSLIINIIGLVLDQSRSAILSLFVVLIFFVLLDIKNILFKLKIKKRTIIIFFAALFLSIFFLLASNYLVPVNRLIRTFTYGSNEYLSTTTRFNLWKLSFHSWFYNVGNFLFGYGFRSSLRLIGAESSHNFFLNVVLWLGLLGLIFILFILLQPLAEILRLEKNSFGTSVGVIVLLVALSVSMFGNVLMDPFYGGVSFLILYSVLGASLRKGVVYG